MRVRIIIPAYNAEKYLEKCIESIFPQLTSEDEIILVNPSSTDETKKICENYVHKHNNIKLYNIEKSGPSKTRNVGIDNANGKYAIFLDADDYVEPNYLEIMLQQVEKDQLLICAYKMIQQESGKENIKQFSKQIELVEFENITKLYEKELLNLVWNKIYDLELIKKNNIKFDERYYKGEDLLFNLKYIQYINSIKVIPNVLYNYISKKTGINKSHREPLESRFERTKEIYNECVKISKGKNIQNIKRMIINIYFLHLRNYIKEEKIYNPFNIIKTFREKTDIEYLFQENLDAQLESLKKMYAKKHIIRMYIKNRIYMKKIDIETRKEKHE